MLVVALGGACWLALHVSGLLGSLDLLTFPLMAAGALTAMAYGVVRWKPVPRWPWILAVVAFLLFLTGGVLREVHGTLGDLSPERSLVPEPFSLLGYVALGVTLWGIARARLGSQWRDVDATLDASITGLAALALAWMYLITPALAQHDSPFGVRLALALYPALSVFLVTIGFRIGLSPGNRPPLAFKLVVAAILATLIGDIVYMTVEVGAAHLDKRLTDAAYALAFLIVIVAAIHPSMGRVTDPVPATQPPSRRGLLFVAVAVAVPGVVLLGQPDADFTDRAALAVIVLALMGVAALRVFRALRDHARSETRLRHQASHDLLTDLPNRVYLQQHLAGLLRSTGAEQPPVAVLFLDLDRFKLINDTLGHPAGDELLRAVASRLVLNVRPDDLVSRVGGDEFVIVLPSVEDVTEAEEIAERTRLVFRAPFSLGDAGIPITTSIGVTVARPGEGRGSPETLLRDADTAMYAAKDRGGNAAVTFDAAMRHRVTRRLALEGELRPALERGQLDLHYQPVVDVSDGRIAGFEALLRWNHPDFGAVPPTDFVPVAEETGQIEEIGAWVIDRAAAQLAAIRSRYEDADPLSMAVNVSVRQLRDERICDQVARALLTHGLPASSLWLEITESLLVENLTVISKTLEAVRRFGVRVAIDDFGTGYSSLAYLRQLPVDAIKVDRQFVDGLEENGTDASLVAAMVAMADSLEFETVVEGVETEGQARRLQELGARQAQGYHYARPKPADGLPQVIETLGLVGQRRLRAVADPT